MKIPFLSSEKNASGVSPSTSLDDKQQAHYEQNYPGAHNGVASAEEAGLGYPTTGAYDDDLHVPCPPHTTERRLVTRIDLHVVPFLCVLYLLGRWRRRDPLKNGKIMTKAGR